MKTRKRKKGFASHFGSSWLCMTGGQPKCGSKPVERERPAIVSIEGPYVSDYLFLSIIFVSWFASNAVIRDGCHPSTVDHHPRCDQSPEGDIEKMLNELLTIENLLSAPPSPWAKDSVWKEVATKM